MPTVFPGWYIKVTRRSFLSKTWEVRFHDGRHSAELQITPCRTKRRAEDIAQAFLETVCKDRLEECKQEQPEIFKEILSDPRFVWKTNGPMGDIPLGKIAQKLYPEATKTAKSQSKLEGTPEIGG